MKKSKIIKMLIIILFILTISNKSENIYMAKYQNNYQNINLAYREPIFNLQNNKGKINFLAGENEDTRLNYKSICNDENPGIKQTAKILGYVILAIKWLVPLLIIVLGMVELGKAVISSDEQAISKAVKSLVTKFIIGVIIFFIPTIILAILNLIEITNGIESESDNNFGECTYCLFDPINKCEIKNVERHPQLPNLQLPDPEPDTDPSPSNPSTPQNPTDSNTTSTTTVKSLNNMSYIETVPDNVTSNLPLIIFLHGTGERGKIDGLKAIKPVTFVTSNQAFKNGKFIFIAPLLPSGSSWLNATHYNNTMNIINKTIATYNINRNKIIIMGFSLGGQGVWHFVDSNPNFYSAAVPVSGCPSNSNPKNYTSTPILAISGNQESNILSCVKPFVNEINKAGGNAQFSTAGTGHISAQSSFPNDNVFTWALSQ